MRMTLSHLPILIVAALFAASAFADTNTDMRIRQMRTLLSDPTRPAADKTRDASRKPARVIAFLGLDPGMTVLDLFASSGYYTEVDSKAVGPTGKVYAQNNPAILAMRNSAVGHALTARLENNRLPNVQRMDVPLASLPIPAGSLDAITFVLNFHDIYNYNPQDAVKMLEQLKRLLKPHGFIALIDHVGVAGNDNAKLHRVQISQVKKALTEAGLKIEKQSKLLRNPADNHKLRVFNPAIRGHTDRFLFKVVRA